MTDSSVSIGWYSFIQQVFMQACWVPDFVLNTEDNNVKQGSRCRGGNQPQTRNCMLGNKTVEKCEALGGDNVAWM